MYSVSSEQFNDLVNKAVSKLPKTHLNSLKNVALLVEDLPSLEQRRKLELRNDQTLLGLYEGVPLSERQGMQKVLPDKITLFKIPLEHMANNEEELAEQIRHTIWHEVAHYYGLDHKAISELE